MRWFIVLAVAALVAVSFSGCSDKKKDDDATTTSSSTSTSRSGTTTSGTATSTSTSGTATTSSSSPSGGATNIPPVGTLSSSTPAEAGTTGLFSVVFKLEGSDVDNDALSWTLDFGDAAADANGTTLPASVPHNYTAGSYSVTYKLTDGKATAQYNLTLQVGAGGGATQQFTGTILIPDPYAIGTGLCLISILSSTLPVETFGAHFTFADVNDWAFAFDVSGMVAVFVDDAGNVLGSGESGTVPAGATGAYTCGNAPTTVNTAYVLTLTEP